MNIMPDETKLIVVKIIHTLVWIFFNVVIFYMLYAVIINKLDAWLWIGYGLIALEGVTLIIFKCSCPITNIARKYSISSKDNFDIYLPNWLAKNTVFIYTSILAIVTILTIYQLIK
jgi:hypothetical protein